MQLQDDQDWVQLLGLDRLPEHIIGKRVTELMDLSGKKAFVTGAGGDGTGQAIANRLAGCGADVALIGRTFEKVERRAKEVEQRWGCGPSPSRPTCPTGTRCTARSRRRMTNSAVWTSW